MCENRVAPKFVFWFFGILFFWICVLGIFGFLDFWIFGIPWLLFFCFFFVFFGFLEFWIFAFAGAVWAPHPPSCFVLAQQGSPAGSGAAGPLAFYPKAPNIPYAPRKQVCPLVGISKHWGANSTLLADTQKPQPQLGQNVQALRPGLRQTLQP